MEAHEPHKATCGSGGFPDANEYIIIRSDPIEEENGQEEGDRQEEEDKQEDENGQAEGEC